MIRPLLYLITDHLPARMINDGERTYLERYYIGTLLGWRFYLHRFVGDDPDRGLHDHPWPRAFSLVLAGWYLEQTAQGWRPVRWFNHLTSKSRHRVVLPSSGTVWTLFFHRAKKVHQWGFYAPDGTFTAYKYTREGNQDEWWLTAPKGREMRT